MVSDHFGLNAQFFLYQINQSYISTMFILVFIVIVNSTVQSMFWFLSSYIQVKSFTNTLDLISYFKMLHCFGLWHILGETISNEMVWPLNIYGPGTQIKSNQAWICVMQFILTLLSCHLCGYLSFLLHGELQLYTYYFA